MIELPGMSSKIITRRKKAEVLQSLRIHPAVAILGQHQVGKTTLAKEIAADFDARYYDFETEGARRMVDQGRMFQQVQEAEGNRLVVLDEVHNQHGLFSELKGIIDASISQDKDKAMGMFLLLDSSSQELANKSNESMIGRLGYVYLDPLNVLEVDRYDIDKLWRRGGLPSSFLQKNDDDSNLIRRSIIDHMSGRELADRGLGIDYGQRMRLMHILADRHGGMLNVEELANDIKIKRKPVERFLDLLADLRIIRLLQPYEKTVTKTLVKTPKFYYRDSGMLHWFLGIIKQEELEVHRQSGYSWESFVIENILRLVHRPDLACFYRTRDGAEIDLVLKMPGDQTWAIDIKEGYPKISRGMTVSLNDLKPDRSFVVHTRDDLPPTQGKHGIEFVSLLGICHEINAALE